MSLALLWVEIRKNDNSVTALQFINFRMFHRIPVFSAPIQALKMKSSNDWTDATGSDRTLSKWELDWHLCCILQYYVKKYYYSYTLILDLLNDKVDSICNPSKIVFPANEIYLPFILFLKYINYFKCIWLNLDFHKPIQTTETKTNTSKQICLNINYLLWGHTVLDMVEPGDL